MKVAWITHMQLFSGKPAGGAEMSDEDMIRKAPPGVDVRIVRPFDEGIKDMLLGVDKVVMTGTEGLPLKHHETIITAARDPIFWAHRGQDIFPHNGDFLRQFKHFVALTPDHLKYEQAWIEFPSDTEFHINPGPMDTHDLYPDRKEPFAIWPHRNVWHKGLDAAEQWAHINDVELRVMSGKPRSEVIKGMRRATWVILLSKIFDAGPRSIIEGQLCECFTVTKNVGLFKVPASELREIVTTSAKRFWGVVCDS